MNQETPHYHTYILRIWLEQDAPQTAARWRITLLDPTQDQRYAFASLEQLADFLASQLENTRPLGGNPKQL